MKKISSFVTEIPKLELGEVATRAQRLTTWFATIERLIRPAGMFLRQWFSWNRRVAQEAYTVYLSKPIHLKEKVTLGEQLPDVFEDVEAWLHNKFLDAMPKDVKDWHTVRMKQGHVEGVATMIWQFAIN
jgi:hypothetical protein